jgi:hypothetical protein
MLNSKLSAEVNRIATTIAEVLACLSREESLNFMSSLVIQIAHQKQELESFAEEMSIYLTQKKAEKKTSDPSDVGAPVGVPKPIPVPPEILAAAIRDFSEVEVTKSIQEIRSGGGYQFKDLLADLEKSRIKPLPPQ